MDCQANLQGSLLHELRFCILKINSKWLQKISGILIHLNLLTIFRYLLVLCVWE